MLLTADSGSGIPAQTNVSELERPEEVIGTIGSTVDFLVGREDTERAENRALGVREEILADLIAAEGESLRELEIAPLVDRGKGIEGIGVLGERVLVDAVFVPLTLHAGIKILILLLEKVGRVGKHGGDEDVLALLVVTFPAVPVDPAIAATTVRAHKAAAHGKFRAMQSGIVRNRRDD